VETAEWLREEAARRAKPGQRAKVGALIAQIIEEWRRRPGRRDEERARFDRLMQKLDRLRVQERLTQRELARRLGTNKAVVHNWLRGRSIGRKASVERIRALLSGQKRRGSAKKG